MLTDKQKERRLSGIRQWRRRFDSVRYQLSLVATSKREVELIERMRRDAHSMLAYVSRLEARLDLAMRNLPSLQRQLHSLKLERMFWLKCPDETHRTNIRERVEFVLRVENLIERRIDSANET